MFRWLSFVLLLVAFSLDAKVVTVNAPFATERSGERASVDMPFVRDLSTARGISFRFRCANMGAFRGFSCYVRCSGRWFHASFAPSASGQWQTIRLNKENFAAEGGQHISWSKADTVRISGWRGGEVDSSFSVDAIAPVTTRPLTLVLQAQSVIAKRGTGGDEAKYAAVMCRSLDALGFEPLLVNDVDLTPAALSGIGMVALPMNPSLPPQKLELLRNFAARGGRLLVCYLPAPGICELLGITSGKTVRPLGGFSGFDLANGGVDGQPRFAPQASWAAVESRPCAGGKVVARWRSFDGKPTAIPASIATGKGVFLTHVWMGGDGVAADFLRAMCVYCDARLGAAAVASEMRRVGLAALPVQVRNAGWKKQFEHVRGLAKGALLQRARNFAPFARKQLPFRGYWCHSAWGVPGESWETTVSRLADAGINNLFVNIAWGGVAYYDSKTLPMAESAVKNGSPVAPCIKACRSNGVAFHAWKVCFNGSNGATPKSWTAKMRQQKRFTVDSKGVEKTGWLCPSHPENRRAEVNAALEMAALPGVAGVHLDYIRYSTADYCFCNGCRERFEAALGEKLGRWPADALPGGKARAKWESFRRNNISDVVKRISAQMRSKYPKVKFSAAVFDNHRSCRISIGQDWKMWCRMGWMDFVCPMDYLDSAQLLSSTLAMQKPVVAGTSVKLYPGLGYTVWKSADRTEMLFDQIKAVANAGLDGFLIYNLDASAGLSLPMLKALK